MIDISPETSVWTLNTINVAQGFGLGFVFVPLNTLAFATLPAAYRTNGTALWTLIRSIGSSVGISIVIAQLTSMTTQFHSQLAEHVVHQAEDDQQRVAQVVAEVQRRATHERFGN